MDLAKLELYAIMDKDPRWRKYKTILFIIWVLIYVSFMVLSIFGIDTYIWSGFIWLSTFIVFLILLLIWGTYVLNYGLSMPLRLIRMLYKKSSSLNTALKKELIRLSRVDTIIKMITWIYETLKSIQSLRRYIWWIFSKDTQKILNEYFRFMYTDILSLITNLRSDLSARLLEQQKSLEWAKTEVEKHIGWTSELEQVSELQKARLDRQIEQFEELQRVLVKI